MLRYLVCECSRMFYNLSIEIFVKYFQLTECLEFFAINKQDLAGCFVQSIIFGGFIWFVLYCVDG